MVKKRLLTKIIISLSAFIITFSARDVSVFAGTLIDESTLITADTLKFITPPPDFRAYFMLQSINNTTVVLIGDFIEPEKVILLVTDEGADNSIDSIAEYYPDTKKYKKTKTPSSKLFKSDIAELKKEIIEGTIYEKNYSYQMKTISALKKKLNENSDIFNSNGGYIVYIYDPEKVTTRMSEFYFRVKDEGYDLIFKTNYYKLYNTAIPTPISHSVYCRDTKDPVVVKYVKELLGMVKK